jgi:hypothetical protein
MEGACEYGMDFCGSIKDGEFLWLPEGLSACGQICLVDFFSYKIRILSPQQRKAAYTALKVGSSYRIA